MATMEHVLVDICEFFLIVVIQFLLEVDYLKANKKYQNKISHNQ